MRISKRLPLLVVASSIVAAVSVGYFSFQNASRELHRATTSELVALRDDRHAAVGQYFQSIREDLELIASSNQVVDAVTAFTEAFGGFDMAQRSDFEKTLRWVFDPNNMAGNRDRLRSLKDPAYIRYQEVHDRFHPWFELVMKLRGYYDLFLLSPRGDVIYTVFKKPDFVSNLYQGPWRDTDLARILDRSLNSQDGRPEAFFDFSPYEPSNNAPAAFIGRKIIDKGRIIGVISFQMPIARINKVMQVTAGMGETGETYLVGQDGFMRSDSRFSTTSTILKQQVKTSAVKKAIAGETGVEVIDDFRNVPVLSAYRPFDFLGKRWAILSEKDIAEIEAPSREMRQTALLIGIAACLAVGILGTLIAFTMTKPLAQLSSAFQRFGETRIPGDIPYVGKNDEIGDLARAFDLVTKDIGTYIAEREKAEANAAAKQAHLRLALDNMPGGMLMVGKDLNLVIANEKYGELFSIPDDILVPGKPIMDMLQLQARREDFNSGDLDLMVNQITEPFRSGGSARFERQLSDGRAMEIHIAPTPEGGTVAVARDVTLQKAAEEALAEKNRVLEDLSTKLSHYLSPQVYESIFSGERDVSISTDRKKLTVFFSDIKDFTATTEDLEPEELTFLLNDYLTKMSEIALEHGATIDKYIGDAMLLFFGDPTSRGVKEDALACVKMAIDMQRRMVELRAKWRDLGHERPIHMRIGINTGYCNVGNFGSEARMDYTIIGGEVNLAARLEGIAEPDGIMLANETYSLVRHEIDGEEQEPIRVKGISREVRPYAVTGIFDDLDAESDFIRAENDAMRVHVDLRKLDEKGRIAAADELEKYAEKLRK